jgi:transposase
MQEALFGGMDAAAVKHAESNQLQATGAVRMRLADRSQVAMQLCSVDELVALDHRVRVVWDAVCQMNLSLFEVSIQSRPYAQGRSANDVRVMVGLWLWATVNNVAGGRELERLCHEDITFKWMCGNLSMNYHTLNDFRVEHRPALEELFTATLGRLTHAGLVKVRRISQDGLRVRAGAGGKSFKKRPTLEAHLAQAKAHLADLRKLEDSSDPTDVRNRQDRRKMAAAKDRVDRVGRALSQLTEVEKTRAKSKDKKRRETPATASSTDPEARMMKMPNGGFNAAYNVPLAADPQSRAILGVSVSNSGGDATQSEPMRQQVEQGTGQKVSEHLMDGGYVNHDAIERAAADGVTIYAPVREAPSTADPHARQPQDSDVIAQWRSRMNTEEGKAIYHQRASTSETVNADLRTFRGLGPFHVRGLFKVTCVALWAALAYNLMHFASALT